MNDHFKMSLSHQHCPPSWWACSSGQHHRDTTANSRVTRYRLSLPEAAPASPCTTRSSPCRSKGLWCSLPGILSSSAHSRGQASANGAHNTPRVPRPPRTQPSPHTARQVPGHRARHTLGHLVLSLHHTARQVAGHRLQPPPAPLEAAPLEAHPVAARACGAAC